MDFKRLGRIDLLSKKISLYLNYILQGTTLLPFNKVKQQIISGPMERVFDYYYNLHEYVYMPILSKVGVSQKSDGNYSVDYTLNKTLLRIKLSYDHQYLLGISNELMIDIIYTKLLLEKEIADSFVLMSYVKIGIMSPIIRITETKSGYHIRTMMIEHIVNKDKRIIEQIIYPITFNEFKEFHLSISDDSETNELADKYADILTCGAFKLSDKEQLKKILSSINKQVLQYSSGRKQEDSISNKKMQQILSAIKNKHPEIAALIDNPDQRSFIYEEKK